MKLALAFAILSLSLAPHAAAAVETAVETEEEEGKIYTCTDADGVVIHRDEPCDTMRKKKIAPPSPEPVVKTSKPVKPAKPATTYVLRSSGPPKPSALKNVPWEPTWQAFVEAMNGADKRAAVRCLASEALASLGPRIEAAPPESLREMVAPFGRVVVEGDVGPYWSIRVHRKGALPKWVFFARNARGEWKIAAI